MNITNSNINSKNKPCKGVGYAIGFGCGESALKRKYGLCKNCYSKWLFLPENEEFKKKFFSLNKKKVDKDKKEFAKEKKKKLITTQDLKRKLQPLVNKIARLIDAEKGCISCNHGWEELPFRRKADAGHYTSVGSNESLRFNLFNIHKQCSICNTYLSGNQSKYIKGLKRVYGDDYAEYVDTELNKLFPLMKWSMIEIENAIKEARAVIKEIEIGKDYTRKEVNDKLGLYN